MTAQVHSRTIDGGEPAARRRKKITAFALAGLVATAGIAGVVVTSSAYFTDVKEIGTNTVTLRGVDIEAYTSGGSVVIDAFNLDELAPLAGATSGEFALAPTKTFDVKNISTSDFKYKVEVTDIVLKRKDGTTALPTTGTASVPSEAEIAGVVKINMVRAALGGTPAYSPTAGVTLTSLGTTPTILGDGTADAGSTLKKMGTAASADAATVGFRIWIEEASLSTWSTAKKNALQDLKITYKLKLTATQLTV